MADGRDVVAALINQLSENKGKIIGVFPTGQEALDKIVEGFTMVQKKFFLKTQGGTDSAKDCVALFNELMTAIDAGGDVQAKFEEFAGPANTLITTAAKWVIRMT